MRFEILKNVYLVAAGRYYYTHPLNCNVYLIIGDKELALIDAGAGLDDSIIESLQALGFDPRKISKVIITHSHWDHAGGARRIKEISGAEIAIHEQGVEVLEKGLYPYKTMFKPVKVDIALKEGDKIDIYPYELQVIYTPGHTLDSICLLMKYEGRKVLFSGDTVKAWGKLGITGAETDFRLYKKSLERLSELKIDVLLPGHEIFIVTNAYEHVDFALECISHKWEDFIEFPHNLLYKRLRERWGISP
jgi:glyoxylase-like metal-dependent hydrolase (beta-lactamase superfamily II)